MRHERVAIDMALEDGRDLYVRVSAGGAGRTKRAVPMPTDAERVGTQGACLYACRAGHVWMVFLVRSEGGFRPVESSDIYCEDDPCASGTDEDALGIKVSATRHWTMR